MDLESELRLAMADHVAKTSAPEALVTAVHHRHRRRVARQRAGVLVAAVVAAGVMALPAYQTLRATPAANTTTPTHEPVGSRTAKVLPPAPGPLPPVPSPSPTPAGTGSVPTPTAAGTTPGRSVLQPSGVAVPSPDLSWVTYLPSGLKSVGPCLPQRLAGHPGTVCRWTGGPGWVEVDVVRSPGLIRPEELGVPSGVPRYTSVHGRPALGTDSADGGGRVAWIERPGVGVVVQTSPSLAGQLMQVASGVHP